MFSAVVSIGRNSLGNVSPGQVEKLVVCFEYFFCDRSTNVTEMKKCLNSGK